VAQKSSHLLQTQQKFLWQYRPL